MNYSGCKLACLYDTNVKEVLKKKVTLFLKKVKNKSYNNCRVKNVNSRKCITVQKCKLEQYKSKPLLKLILINFKEKYGNPIILLLILELLNARKLDIDKNYVLKNLSFFSREKKKIINTRI